MNYTQRSKLIDRLCGAGLMLICFEIIYNMANSAFVSPKSTYNFNDITNMVYISGGVILIIGIAFLIYAYLKKKGSMAFTGLELLVLSFLLVTIPGSHIDYVFPFNKLHALYIFQTLFVVYYVGKSIYIVKDITKTNTKKPSKKKSKKVNKR